MSMSFSPISRPQACQAMLYPLPAAAGNVLRVKLNVGKATDMGVAGNWQCCLDLVSCMHMMKDLQMTTALRWPQMLCFAFSQRISL